MYFLRMLWTTAVVGFAYGYPRLVSRMLAESRIPAAMCPHNLPLIAHPALRGNVHVGGREIEFVDGA